MMEQNQIFNNVNNNNNYLFGINEEAIKHNKKIKNKITKSPNETPNSIANVNPNNTNYSNNKNNKNFYKNNINNNNVSINNKGSLSMQGNKNTIPNFNPNLNFMIQQSPQQHQNSIPLGMINNQNLNMTQQRTFYHNNNNNNSNNNNMNKRHVNNNTYRTVNSDKNVIGGINNKSDFFNNQNIQKGNFQKFHNNNNINNNNFNLQNQNLQQQRMFQQAKNEELMNYKNNNQNIQMLNKISNNNNIPFNQIQNKKSNIISLHVKIKLNETKEEILELRPEDGLFTVTNILKKNNNISDNMISLINQKIKNALYINKFILDMKPHNFYLKKMNTIKNIILENERNNSKINNNIEPLLKRCFSYNNNIHQCNNYITNIKPSFDEVKENELLNITQ